MAHAYYHAKSSARRFGGIAEDYLEIHSFMDSTKGYLPDNRHRLLLHNAWGIFFVERIFGPVWTRKSDGKQVPTRTILEQHVLEDLRFIPTLEQCFARVPLEDWLSRNARALSQEENIPHDHHPNPTYTPADRAIDPRISAVEGLDDRA